MAHRINRVIFCYVLLTLAIGAEGCQRGPTWNLATVEGTVTKDGHPLGGIEVVFLADPDVGTQGPRASGITDEAGHYCLRTDNGDYGAAVGKHRVVLCELKAPKGRRSRSGRKLRLSEKVKRPEEQPKTVSKPPRVPSSYGHFDKTPLRAEVGCEPLTFDIAIP